MGQTFCHAADAHEAFHIIVPRGKVFIADRPIYGDPFFCVGFEIEVTEPVALSSPGEGSAADLVAADPVIGFFLNIGVFPVVYKKLF
jgi:hypothetical protein